jgi:cold shock CspA family protein
MATGIIKSIRGDKGIGFIKRDGGAIGSAERFFDHSSVQEVSFGDLYEGQRVNFTEERDPRVPSRFRAVAVRPVAEPPTSRTRRR